MMSHIPPGKIYSLGDPVPKPFHTDYKSVGYGVHRDKMQT